MSLPAYMYLYDENGQLIKGSCMALGREGASFPVYQLGKILQANQSGRFLAFSNPECWQGQLFSRRVTLCRRWFYAKIHLAYL